MAQKAQVIDVTKSYIPGDPNAFPENLVNTSQEDGEEKTPAVMPFEGYNFLPTSYGYRSYFGTTSRLDVPQVPARVQFILSYQSDTFINNLIALCEDGIWIIDPTANTNTWKHVVVHTFSAEVFEEWTYCIIENTLYMYKQGKSSVYYTSNTDDVPNGLSISIPSFTPSFLNMSGQLGIFRAGTRLGFWDSANSISWSSNLDLTDFTPSLENLAGNTIFGLVTGRVVHVREQGEGYVIYATKSIVGVSFSAEGNMLWDSHLISDVCGIAYGREVCFGVSNNEHYVHTSIGLHRIGSYNGLTKVHEFTPIATELSDVLAEERDPIYLDCMGGRYIYIHAISDTYINGKVSFTSVTVDSLDIEAVFNLDPSLVSRELFVKMIQNFEKNSADSTYGDTLVKYTADGIPFDILEWEASYRAISPLGMYEKLVNPSLGASFAYQNASTLDRSSIGWSNRTPSSGVFVPPNGDYNSLDSGVPLVSYSDFLIRGDKNDDFSKPISKTLRFQTDAFTHEDNKGTYDLSYQLRKSCGTEPSFLEINGRTSYGLLEGMYNVASHWKDYEKRQKLVIDNFTGIVENLKPFNWNAYSVDGTLEAAIEAPIYEIFDLFKPYGCVGIAPVGKGFSFFKNYREYYDCVIGSFREVTEINTYKEVENCEFNSPVSYSLEDKMDIVLSVPTGGGSIFPNPGKYPITVSRASGGAISLPSGYKSEVLYCIADPITGEVSEYIKSTALFDNCKINITIAAGSALPGSYVHRVVFTYDKLYPDSTTREFYYKDFTDLGSYVINSLSEMTQSSTFPSTSVNVAGNIHAPAPIASEWYVETHAVYEGSGWYTGTSEFWVAQLVNNALSEAVYIGSYESADGLNPPVVRRNVNDAPAGTCIIYCKPPVSGTFPRYMHADFVTTDGSGYKYFEYDEWDGGSWTFSTFPDYSYKKVYQWASGNPTVNAFPNPGQFPLVAPAAYTPGTDFDPGPVDYGYVNTVVYAVIDDQGNESDITTLITLTSDNTYTVASLNPPPLGYSYRLYLVSKYGNLIDLGGGASLDTTEGFIKYRDVVLDADDSVTISSLDFFTHSITSYPVGIVDKVGNSYVDPLPSIAGFDIIIYTPGTVQLEIRVALNKNNRYGPFSYIGSATTDVYSGFDLVTPALPAGYSNVVYEVRINHPNYKHRVIIGTTVGSYRFNITDYPGTKYPLDPSYAWQFSGPLIWGIDIAGGSTDYYASIPYDEASPTYIQDVITNSQVSGIEFAGLGTMEFKDLSYQAMSSPLSTDGTIPLMMQNFGGVGDFQASCTINHRVKVTKDWDLNAGDLTRFEVRTATQEQADTYPFLVYVKGVDALISIYRSYNQVFSQIAGYGRYLQLIASTITGPNGDQHFVPSSDPTEYYTDWEGDYIRVYGRIWDGLKSQWRDEVVMLMQQTEGFIYEYKIAEEPFGSIVDNKKVDLTGSSLVPTLDTEGVYNTLGGFFMPKNKISATLNGSSLTLSASTSIGEYEAKEAEILDFLTPANNAFEVPKYLMPPTYDNGEYWFLVKDAEKIYSSGTIFDFKVGEITSFDNIFWNTPLYLDDFVPYDVPDNDSTVIQELLGTLPGSSFILQEGGISGSYPTFVGAHIFDLFLKKWGKMKENYKIIFAYSALNNGDNGFIPYSNFGMDCGVVLEVDNKISLFDKAPVDSWMRIGKIGYSRLGFTRAYEVKAMFRSPSTGKITLDVSLDGRTLETSLQASTSFNNKVKCDMYPDISGRWHTLKIEGNYDLQYLEFRGTIAGRR